MSFNYTSGPPQLLLGPYFVSIANFSNSTTTLFQPASGTSYLVTQIGIVNTGDTSLGIVPSVGRGVNLLDTVAVTANEAITLQTSILIDNSHYLTAGNSTGGGSAAFACGFQLI